VTFVRREDAQRFIEEVGGNDPELEERELEAGGAELNSAGDPPAGEASAAGRSSRFEYFDR